MTKKTRTILFSFFVFLFVLAAPAIILYSQGYRFDFETKKIVQTGGLYFKIWPGSAQIHLDGKLNKKTDFFFGSVFWQNLLPKKYKMKIEKENYQPWQKTLEVREKLVTEVKNVVLFPQKTDFKVLSKDVENYWPLPDKKRFILEKINPGTQEINLDGWRLVLYDVQRNVQSSLLDEATIGKKERTEILSLTPSPDSKKLLLTASIGEKIQNFVIELNGQTTPLPLSLSFLGDGVENINFNQINSQKLFFLKNDSLFEADLTKKEVSAKPLLKKVANFTQVNDSIYFLESNPPAKKGGQYLGFVYKTDLSGKIIEKINEEPISLKQETEYKIIVLPERIFLQENDILYLLNSETKSFEKFFEGFKDLKIPPDSKKLAYFSDKEIWLLFLKDIQEQPSKKTGDTVFLGKFSDNINDVFWLNSDYLILNLGNRVKVIETDDRDKIQTWDVGEFVKPKAFFNESDKKLYILSEGNLFISESFPK